MNKTLLIVIVVIAALALGISGAYAVSLALPELPLQQALEEGIFTPPFTRSMPDPEESQEDDEEGGNLPEFGSRLPWRDRLPGLLERFGGRRDDRGRGQKGFIPPRQLDRSRLVPPRLPEWGLGGIGPWGNDFAVSGERITMEQALQLAQEYIDARADNLSIARMYEFERVFYAVVVETDTGIGAFQLIIQPVSGIVRFETGPCAVWNTAYGRRFLRDDEPDANQLTMEEAAAQAQQALDDAGEDAAVNPDGIAFYGYYTFEYSVDDEVIGLVSVNAADGDYWFHHWLGELISREDIAE